MNILSSNDILSLRKSLTRLPIQEPSHGTPENLDRFVVLFILRVCMKLVHLSSIIRQSLLVLPNVFVSVLWVTLETNKAVVIRN